MNPAPLKPQDAQPVVRYANYHPVAPGATWGPRRIPDFELIMVVDGRIDYTAHGIGDYSAGKGCVIFIPPDVPHTVRAPADAPDTRFSCIHGELLPGKSWSAGDYRPSPMPPTITDTRMDPVLHDLFQRCAMEYKQFHPYRKPLLSAILREIWLRMAGHWRRPPPRRRTQRAAAMAAHIRSNLRHALSRRDLAREFHVTPEHVNALFRNEFGATPGAFIQWERIRLAYRLLADEGLSVKEAACRTGFNDQFHFSRVFKRLIGRPPSRIRGR